MVAARISGNYPYVFKGHQYALDVVDGKIPASKYVVGACQRYLLDIEKTDANFYFDFDAAEKYLRLTQKFEHTIGKWATKNIVYEPWQCFVWMNIFGFLMKETKFRRFRIAHIEIARGNGKSPMASQCALYMLCLDDPVGNQISTVATKKDQARIVLDAARNMARKNSSFLSQTGTRVLAHTIVHPQSDSHMRALSSDSSSMDGLNDILAVMDELHAMKRDTFDVVYSGMSKRKDSLTLCITTAGFDIDSVGHSQSAYAKKVCLAEEEDDQFFSIVYCLEANEDWTDEDNWIKANPNLGVSVDLDTLRAKVKKAMVTPSDVPNLKTKHFNIWLSEADAYFDQSKWDACADPTMKIEDFLNKDCRTALDIASNTDLASTAYIFREQGIYHIFDNSYIPEATLLSLRGTNTLYDNCVAQKHLISTTGEAISHKQIREDILANATRFRILEIAYDPWNATEMSQNLANKIEVVKFAMNVANFSEPMKKLDSLMREGKIRHNGSPLLRWCLGNVVAKEDHNSNVFPRKSHPKLKIDPIVSILMALALWLQDTAKESIYEERGIRTL